MGHFIALKLTPSTKGKATAWAKDWRRRWFTYVGCCEDYLSQGVLYLAYSEDRPPEIRQALQAELEAQPNGIAEVVAVCAAMSRGFNRQIAANRRRAA